MAGDLTIKFPNVRNAKGSIQVAVFKGADGFPEDGTKAFKSVRAPARDSDTVLQIKGLPPGQYAVAAFHDENDNGKLDTNFLGIPKEGCGSSNNPDPKFRAPRFLESVFDIDEPTKEIVIRLRYFFEQSAS